MNTKVSAARRVAIEIRGLVKKYGFTKALDGVDLDVPAGSIYGFLGPNGAGKTTTIRCLMGFISPGRGDMRIFGKPVGLGGVALRARIGYLSSDSVFYPRWSPLQHIEFAEAARGARGGGRDLAARLDLDLRTKYAKLSSGNKQKLALVLALMHRPDLLILDEPTRGLDPLLQRELYAILRETRERGGTVFMSSHNLGEVEAVCDEVGIIRAGRMVASDTLASLRQMQTHYLRVATADRIRARDFELPGVKVTHANTHELTAEIDGDFNAFVRAAAKYDLRDLSITHASLEEIFMRYYDE